MKKIIKALFLKQRDNKYAKIVTGYNNKEKEKGYSMKEQDLRLEYQQAARNWEEVLPLGNGSLGAMVWGGA
ncbi:MAG: glycoside hydrolase N-terminal domain-containing protein, partial [Enterococcus lemanii]